MTVKTMRRTRLCGWTPCLLVGLLAGCAGGDSNKGGTALAGGMGGVLGGMGGLPSETGGVPAASGGAASGTGGEGPAGGPGSGGTPGGMGGTAGAENTGGITDGGPPPVLTTDGSMPPPPPFEGMGDPWEESAPKATCGPDDVPDPGLQGLDTDVRCNLNVVGQVAAPHFLSLAWYEDCAYVNGSASTSVVDVSDPSNPQVVEQLTTAGMQSNWETMKVHEGRGLLAGYQSNGPVVDVYDVSADCTAPVFRSSTNVGGSGHSGNFSDDGTIYYASSLYTSQIFPLDVTDPTSPAVIAGTIPRGAHDLFIAKGGTRGYFAYPDLLTGLGVGSLAIMDLTPIQERAPGATATLIHEWTWEDGNISQYPIAITYRGKDYLMVTDELGSGACDNPAKPPYGYARIFDISDETNPVLTAKIKTEAQNPCTGALPGGSFFGVGTHYCNVDRRDDPRLLSCGLWAGGVRVFDIRNPWRPKEVAYFDTVGEGVPGLTRILVEERQLWVATTPGTFYVLEFREGVLDEIVE